MRRLLLIVLLVMVVAIFFLRQRMFLRDPLGKLYVNNVQLDTARVFINYSNDVLVTTFNTDAAPAVMVVQHWDMIPGRPQTISCVSTLMCLTEDDHAAKIALGGHGYNPKTVMSDREVSVLDDAGDTLRVVIR
jgi:hypothetical protein